MVVKGKKKPWSERSAERIKGSLAYAFVDLDILNDVVNCMNSIKHCSSFYVCIEFGEHELLWKEFLQA